jgi:hypothetical protein
LGAEGLTPCAHGEIPASAWPIAGPEKPAKNLVQGPQGDLYDVRIGPRAETPAPESEKP